MQMENYKGNEKMLNLLIIRSKDNKHDSNI